MKYKPSSPHPLNAAGDFYVESGSCIACGVPEHLAPELIRFSTRSEDPNHPHCYFARQPSTSEETEHAIQAVAQACCAAVRYAGSDPVILRRLEELDAGGSCDALEGKQTSWRQGVLLWLARLWAGRKTRR